MNAVRSDSSKATKPRRAAAMAARAAGPISTPSPANATLRKWSSVKSARRFATTVIQASPVPCPGSQSGYSGRDSGLRRVPQEELALCRRVRPRHVLLRGAQVVVEVGEDDGRLVEEQLLDLPGQAALRVQVHGGDVLLRQLVVGGVIEVRSVPGALALLGVDGLERRRQVHV